MRINAMNRTLLFIIAIALLACGCTRQQPSDPRLQRLTLSVDTGPQAAIDSLAAIDPATLGEFDRHYYNFLTVKACDKAYIVHTSDSLILDVINHFGRSPKMTEALYYAGRVYSDLGDYPTALRYFHDALDRISDDQLQLKAKIVSQTGRLLNHMRLYDQAIPYIKQSITIDEMVNDSINLPLDHQLLGDCYWRNKQYETALHHIKTALALSNTAVDSALMETYISSIYYKLGNLDSSLTYIRTSPSRAHYLDRDFIYAEAASIYVGANMPDSVKKYAHLLISNPRGANATTGYLCLLNPAMKHLTDNDSIDSYLTKYIRLAENKYDLQNSQSVIIQNSLYNYAVHEREAQRQSEANTRLKGWLISITIIILILTIAVLYLKQRNSRYIIRLQTSLQELERLNARIAAEESNATEATGYLPTTVDIADIPQQISNELAIIEARTDKNPILPESVTESKAFQDLQQMMQQGQPLKTECKLWQDLRQTVTEAFPEFQNTLYRMSGGTIKKDDMDLAILIKLGATPIQLAKLLCKSPGTITYRRRQLLAKLAPEQESISSLDPLIRHI